MKLSTAHDRSFPTVDGTFCEQCQVPWPCDAAIACEDVETLNRIIARFVDGWELHRSGNGPGDLRWRRVVDIILPYVYEPLSDAEAEILRAHLETP